MPAASGPQHIGGFRIAYARAVTFAASAVMLAIVGIMLANVFYRYVLSDAIIWAEDIARMLLVWMTFLFVGAAFARGEMVAVELVTSRLTPRLRGACLVPAYALCVAFLAVLVWYGWRFANLSSAQTIPAMDHLWKAISGAAAPLNASIFWLYVAVPFGCALLAVHMLGALIAELRRAIAPGAD